MNRSIPRCRVRTARGGPCTIGLDSQLGSIPQAGRPDERGPPMCSGHDGGRCAPPAASTLGSSEVVLPRGQRPWCILSAPTETQCTPPDHLLHRRQCSRCLTSTETPDPTSRLCGSPHLPFRHQVLVDLLVGMRSCAAYWRRSAKSLLIRLANRQLLQTSHRRPLRMSSRPAAGAAGRHRRWLWSGYRRLKELVL